MDIIQEAGLVENYCRMPNPGDRHPWCFVDGFFPEKEDCNIPSCSYSDSLRDYFISLWGSFLESFGISRTLQD